MNPRTTALKALCCSVILLALPALASAGLQPVDVTQFWMRPDRSAVLQWRIDPAGSEPLRYTICGYWGRQVVESEVTPSEGLVKVPVKLGQGFYEIVFPQLKQTFGICVVQDYQGPVDAFFCIDSALSWLEPRPQVRERLVRLLKRFGIGLSRERLGWAAIERQRGQWDAKAASSYDALRRMYAQQGIKVLEMFHDAPGWLGAGNGNPYPADLLNLGRSWEAIRGRWQPYWAALEIWNEPDIHFGNRLPADQYVPVTKAIAYALREARPAVPLVGGVFTHICPDEYRQACARNGMLDHLDVVSFHTYLDAETLEDVIASYRAWLKAYGKESMPLWITESGKTWQAGPERPERGKDAHIAMHTIMKAVEARACGIAAYFPFVYVFYEENGAGYGMLGKECSPLRMMGAYLQTISALSHKPYRGDLAVDDPAVKRARVFGDDSESVIVLYTGRSGSSVKLDLPIKRLQGIDGRAVKQRDAGRIPVTDGLTYVWCDSAKIAGLLRKDTTAARLYAASRQTPPRRPSPSPIILQPLIDLKSVSASVNGYAIPQERAGRFPFGVRVHNLGERPARVELSVSMASAASHPQAASAGAVAARSIEISALSQTEVRWELDIAELAGAKKACTLTITGRAGGVERVSPLAVDVTIALSASATRPQ